VPHLQQQRLFVTWKEARTVIPHHMFVATSWRVFFPLLWEPTGIKVRLMTFFALTVPIVLDTTGHGTEATTSVQTWW
jgi:hypothetical protein